MHQGRTFSICDCCAIWLANNDDSGCRGYYGHTHELCRFLPEHTVLSGNEEERSCWICDGCGDEMARFANAWPAVELIPVPHVDYPHWPGRLPGCPACEARCHCGPAVAAGTETECIWPGHK